MRSWRWRAACFETIFLNASVAQTSHQPNAQSAPATEVADRWQPFRRIIWDSMAKKNPRMGKSHETLPQDHFKFRKHLCGWLLWAEVDLVRGQISGSVAQSPPCPCRGTARLGQARPQVLGAGCCEWTVDTGEPKRARAWRRRDGRDEPPTQRCTDHHQIAVSRPPSIHLTVSPLPDIAVAIVPSVPPVSARHARTPDADRPTDIPAISTSTTSKPTPNHLDRAVVAASRGSG